MPRGKKFDGRCIRGIVADARKGMKETAIAKKRNISIYHVKKVLGEAPVTAKKTRVPRIANKAVVKEPKPGRKGKFTRKQELDMCREYLDCRSSQTTAKKFGTTNQTVLKVIKNYGIVVGKRPVTTKAAPAQRRGRKPKQLSEAAPEVPATCEEQIPANDCRTDFE